MQVSTEVRVQQLTQAFPISHMTTEYVEWVTLRLTGPDGVEGTGEISADPGFNQNGRRDAEQAGELATRLAQEPGNSDPLRLEEMLAAAAGTVSNSALMLTEMAFLDRAARLRGVPLWALLDLPEPRPVELMTTVPIGRPLPAQGPAKIKLGGPGDAETLRQLRKMEGPVLLDVNRGWDRAEWEAVRPLVADLAPVVLEDPVTDPELLPQVREALPNTAVVLDEGIASVADVRAAVRVASGANVKVMKLGGLFPARCALEHLTEAGAGRMLGCYLEPPRAIAYAAQLAPIADWTDLDGHFWVSPDHPAVPGFRLDSSAPGIPEIAA